MKNLNNYLVIKKNVLLRVDLNVPTLDGIITDNSRIIAIKSTLQKLIKNKNKIFIVSHFGRPKGVYKKQYSMNFMCEYLKKCLDVENVNFLKNFNNIEIEKMIKKMQIGEICLFENIRFYPEEEKNNLNFAKNITKNFDIYINDAFSVSHRSHASIVGFPNFLTSLAGDNLLKEIKNINNFINSKKKPNMAVIGGSKISTKIDLLLNLVQTCNVVAIGGAMANTFLYANNIKIGNSLCEKNLSKLAISILKKAKKFNCKIILPEDVVCADNLKDQINLRSCNVNDVFSNQMILDIGSKTTSIICNHLMKSNSILWNGPLGAFEYKPFERSSVKLANLIKKNLNSIKIPIIAGGGDTISVIKMANALDGFSYISNAGGAFLEWLEGDESPGVLSLKQNNII